MRRQLGGRPTKVGLTAVALAAMGLLVALTLSVSSDVRPDPAAGGVAPEALVDDVPPAVVPDVAAMAVVWLVVTLVTIAVITVAQLCAQPRRGRAPPVLSIAH